MKRGHKDVKSQPALTELADIFVLLQVNELVWYPIHVFGTYPSYTNSSAQRTINKGGTRLA